MLELVSELNTEDQLMWSILLVGGIALFVIMAGLVVGLLSFIKNSDDDDNEEYTEYNEATDNLARIPAKKYDLNKRPPPSPAGKDALRPE